jgi:hypothetical protein
MSVFKIPSGVYKMKQNIWRFWWGGKNMKKRTHWVAWEKMIMLKDRGGLGFRDMEKFNQALLARQGWHLLNNSNSLCAQNMKDKYCPNGNLLDTSFTQNCSQTWRDIMQGVMWRIGDGSKVNIRRSNWIPCDTGLKITGRRRSCRLKWVSQLMKERYLEWDTDVVNRFFWPHDVQEIKKILLAMDKHEDLLA